MSTLYPIVGFALLAVVLFAPHFSETAAKIYWYRRLKKRSCYEQAFFLYTLMRYYKMYPAMYTVIRRDMLRTYFFLYNKHAYPVLVTEEIMQRKLFRLWYQIQNIK